MAGAHIVEMGTYHYKLVFKLGVITLHNTYYISGMNLCKLAIYGIVYKEILPLSWREEGYTIFVKSLIKILRRQLLSFRAWSSALESVGSKIFHVAAKSLLHAIGIKINRQLQKKG